jgi:hypothetical protein
MARIAPNTSNGVGAFPGAPLAAPGMTLDALMARQKEIALDRAKLQPGAIQQPIQGVAYLANVLANKLQQGRADRATAAANQQMAETMANIDPVNGANGAQIGILANYDPDMAMQFLKERADRRQAEAERVTYGPVLTGEAAKAIGLDPTKSYQMNNKTQQYDQVGGGGTSVTVNPPSAEVAAKLGLANGFLDNYDAILQSAQAGEMTGTGWITGVQMGRGNGGAQYRNLLQGTEALVRLLTGAGMSEGEARSRVKQFEPAALDDAPTLVSKIGGLKQALDNVRGAVNDRANAGTAPGAAGGAPPPAAPAPAPAGGAAPQPTIKPDGTVDFGNMTPDQIDAWADAEEAKQGGGP